MNDNFENNFGPVIGRGSQATAGGSGLGLAIARSIAERHRGSLRLQARAEGPGLLAILWWPRA